MTKSSGMTELAVFCTALLLIGAVTVVRLPLKASSSPRMAGVPADYTPVMLPGEGLRLPARPGSGGVEETGDEQPKPADAWKRAINLLPALDPKQDTVNGNWTVRKDGGVASDKTRFSRIEIPYHPPEEYDLRVTFTRVSGDADVNLVLAHAGKQFLWEMGGWDNKVFGFELIDDRPANQNGSTVSVEKALQNDKKYTVIIEVRKDSLKAFLDGKFLTKHTTNYGDMGIFSGWKLRDKQALGLASHSPSIFHGAELLPVSGQGSFTRAVKGQAPAEE